MSHRFPVSHSARLYSPVSGLEFPVVSIVSNLLSNQKAHASHQGIIGCRTHEKKKRNKGRISISAACDMKMGAGLQNTKIDIIIFQRKASLHAVTVHQRRTVGLALNNNATKTLNMEECVAALTEGTPSHTLVNYTPTYGAWGFANKKTT